MDEKTFMALFTMKSQEIIEELTKRGYINHHCRFTSKAEREIQQFINKYKEPLYQAMKEANNDIAIAREKAGLKEPFSAYQIADELVKEGRLEKIGPDDYKVK